MCSPREENNACLCVRWMTTEWLATWYFAVKVPYEGVMTYAKIALEPQLTYPRQGNRFKCTVPRLFYHLLLEWNRLQLSLVRAFMSISENSDAASVSYCGKLRCDDRAIGRSMIDDDLTNLTARWSPAPGIRWSAPIFIMYIQVLIKEHEVIAHNPNKARKKQDSPSRGIKRSTKEAAAGPRIKGEPRI